MYEDKEKIDQIKEKIEEYIEQMTKVLDTLEPFDDKKQRNE